MEDKKTVSMPDNDEEFVKRHLLMKISKFDINL